jgi:hypothetical protein
MREQPCKSAALPPDYASLHPGYSCAPART